jgi:2,4-dienoyl-CoA reductase (NADPH2)
VNLRLGHCATIDDLRDFDEIVMASGVVPRKIAIPGADMAHVIAYNQVITGEKQVGERVAIIGAGGIGFDIASYLLRHEQRPASVEEFLAEWGVDTAYSQRGGLGLPQVTAPPREVHLLQRKKTKPGITLGKTTGWIHRLELKKNGVRFWTGVEYLRVDQTGLWIRLGAEERLLAVDTIVVCAGQEPELSLARELDSAGLAYHLIGGALQAAELDAQRAIAQGTAVADSF